MSESFAHGRIQADSHSANSVDDLGFVDFDVLLVAPSWDQRCTTIANASRLNVGSVIILDFENRGTSGRRDRHESIIQKFAQERSISRPAVIAGRSESVEPMWESVESTLTGIALDTGRPLRILVDMSTCPRFISLAILGWGMSTRLAFQQSFLYSEGEYLGEGPELFSLGKWELLPIPYLYGKYDPRLTRMLYVSVGFEGTKTIRAVSHCDPDRVSLLFPDPGVLPEYVDRTTKCNQPLRDRYCIPDKEVTRGPAYDAVSTWKAMTQANVERPSSENTHYVACGTKPHALALALRSLAVGYPVVFYTKPGEHVESEIRSSGRFWRFDVNDRTVPK